MGFLDGVLGGVMGAGLTQLATSFIEQHGGLPALINQFQQKGLGDLVQSWVGKGSNLPISAEQITHVLGNDQLAQLAGKLGIDPATLAQKLAELLPHTVDSMTPDGVVPHS